MSQANYKYAILNHMPVTINEYSELLVRRFLFERARLAALLPPSVNIEHVGSSAVGIGGKNIIDILIGVTDTEEMEGVRDILTQNGYIEGNDSHSDRVFLASRKDETREGDFHAHICPVSSDTYKDFIILRDFLKNNPKKAEEYFEKKHQFAEAANFDRKKYKALKSAYVSKLLVEAKNRPLDRDLFQKYFSK